MVTIITFTEQRARAKEKRKPLQDKLAKLEKELASTSERGRAGAKQPWQ